ncbi:amidohydrolase family protein [Massilia dura]|uniref:Amidohydrolase family protein n=1 Tax=Pseudoduganella dura TaxID=321982 RepID=A0A6I3XNX7_9BURK|nr:amidohydrolase family protein [Pseudoduganella dura]MUI15421.1 amidohydrolase family protein [Pseudoduganella dura]GGX80028.1 2-pyrone-4,6-dicarboxylate hydrolase [Pseudoduganella dura]
MKTCLPPDANPVRPAYRLPRGACDAHCHVFGPAAKFPYAPDRTYTPPDAPVEALRALHDRLGISRAVIVHASCHGVDNTVTLDAIRSSNGAYRGVANVRPEISDSELADLHAGGIRGIRFNFVKHLGGVPDVAVIETMAQRIAPLGWHMVLHFDAEDIPEQQALLRKITVPFVIDHMGRVRAAQGIGQRPFQLLLSLLRENPLAWVKICGAERVSTGKRPFNDAVPFAQELIATAPERLLWGTDWPHPNISHDMPNDGELVNLFHEFTGSDKVRKQILVDNPAQLYGFDPL